MNKIKFSPVSTILIILLITSCASSPKFKHLNNGDKVTLRYILNYPGYSGMTKTKAKAKRQKFMEETITNIYASAFRLGYFGRSDFDPNNFGKLSGHTLDYGNIPFIYKGDNPPTFLYNYNSRTRSDFGFISSTSYSSNGKRYSGVNYGWSYPLAINDKDEYITSPHHIQNKVSNSVLIITKEQFDNALNHFYQKHNLIDSRKVFIDFLRKHAYKFINYRIPLRTLKKTMFTKYKALQSGAGLSDEVINLDNTLQFSLKEEINRQLVWGLMFLLNSELKANRLNKKQLEIVISVPVNDIFNKYKIEPLNKFIEQ